MDPQDLDSGALGLGSGRAYRFVTRLVWLYGGFAALVAASLALAQLPLAVLGPVRTQAMEVVAGGMGGLVLSSLLMALTALCATQAITAARHWYVVAEDGGATSQTRFLFLRRIGPGIAARQGQAIIVGLGAVLTCFSSWLFWPSSQSQPSPLADPNLVGAIAIAIALCSLVAERMMESFTAPPMSEAPALRRA